VCGTDTFVIVCTKFEKWMCHINDDFAVCLTGFVQILEKFETQIVNFPGLENHGK